MNYWYCLTLIFYAAVKMDSRAKSQPATKLWRSSKRMPRNQSLLPQIKRRSANFLLSYTFLYYLLVIHSWARFEIKYWNLKCIPGKRLAVISTCYWPQHFVMNSNFLWQAFNYVTDCKPASCKTHQSNLRVALLTASLLGKNTKRSWRWWPNGH